MIIYAIIIDNLKEQLREIYDDKRIPIPDNTKRDILIRDRFQCKKCGSKIELQIDHIKPVSWFNKQSLKKANDIDNLQVLCRTCNIQKSNKHDTRY